MRNRLAGETSPYLLQHRDNPVHWYPWCEEAFEEARRTNRPVLLSVGYSACHWCHVMAHESFEDDATAAVMNELFVNIKVDREERPDVDKIYQTAHQLLTQRGGGWPLNMFLTPDDHTPFFGGTYFPPVPRHNMPAFGEILQRVSDFYHEHPEDIQQQNASVQEYLQRAAEGAREDYELDAVVLDEARRQLENSYDTQYAGFGAAPSDLPRGKETDERRPRVRRALRSGRRGQTERRAAGGRLRGGVHDHGRRARHPHRPVFDDPSAD